MFLWTGPKRSGKTTALRALVLRIREEGFAVAGLLAPAVRQRGGPFASAWATPFASPWAGAADGGRRAPVGYDVEDVATGCRAPLLRLAASSADAAVGKYALDERGVALGARALRPDGTHDADLIVVDEFGPLEVAGGLWRPFVDALADSAASVLLVVRDDLASAVGQIYGPSRTETLPASQPSSAECVLDSLHHRTTA